MTAPHIGIALGGGGARGAAHIGVLRRLQTAGIKVDIISGVSAGSVVGAMYALNEDAEWIENRFREILEEYPFRKRVTRYFSPIGLGESFFSRINRFLTEHLFQILRLYKDSVISKEKLKEVISFLVPVKTFEELRLPLKVGATDLNTGESIIYDSGDLISAIVQSCSIPGVIEPTVLNNKILVDGGVTAPIPISMIKNNCLFTIAVDISQYTLKSLVKINMNELKGRSDLITSNTLKVLLAEKADFTINPDTLGLHWSNFDKFDILINQGAKSTDSSIKKLKNLILNIAPNSYKETLS